MDEILYLEPDEEITSVVEKLAGLDGKRVALVLPKNAQLAGSVVNLKLLAREAERQHKTIAIVTQDPVGTSLAAQVGIPVYASPSDSTPVSPAARPRPDVDDVIDLAESAAATAEESPVPVRRYDAPAPRAEEEVRMAPVAAATASPIPKRPAAPGLWRRYRALLVALVLALLAGFTAWFFLIYPQASITLAVASDPVTETVTVVVDNNISAPDNANGHIPGQKLQTDETVKESFDATGSKDVGTKATGSVTISNRLGEAVTVPAGSTLVRGDVTVLTKDAVTVGAATVSLDASGNVSVTPGTAKADVESQSPGEAGNLAPGDFTITSFTGSKREKVTASNSAALSGGESRTVKVVTDDDIAKARGSVADKVKDGLATKLTEQAKDLTVLANTLEIEVVESMPSKQAGDEADRFDLDATVRARTIGFTTAEYQAMIVALVTAKLPEGKELVVTNEDSVETTVESKDYGQGFLTLKGTMRTESVQKVDETALKTLIAGKTAIQAETALKEQEGITEATITLRPTFRRTVPDAASQIRITLTRE
ncbi:hypothetical protein HY374_00150 [Candidatus Berkelbacteria bacterium]|nr:hypothetical protein [Candidatus Berkelbacteria bacterium]